MILTERRNDGVALITLDRPAARNALARRAATEIE